MTGSVPHIRDAYAVPEKQANYHAAELIQAVQAVNDASLYGENEELQFVPDPWLKYTAIIQSSARLQRAKACFAPFKGGQR